MSSIHEATYLEYLIFVSVHVSLNSTNLTREPPNLVKFDFKENSQDIKT